MKESKPLKKAVAFDAVYKPSEDIVARDIQGELIIVPIASGIADTEDEIFTLNATGRAVWQRLDGKSTLREVAQDLSKDFEGSPQEIEKDILGITEELIKRKILVEVNRN